MPIAERCLTWIDEYGDRDGDGFQEYQTRSPLGYENMAWKDAGDAVLYPDGTLVKGPKALCELQGYVYAAWHGHGGDLRRARRTGAGAVAARQGGATGRAFDRGFWNEEFGGYAYALDGDKKQVPDAWSPTSAIACGPASFRRRRRGARGGAADGARHVLRLGHPHAVGRPHRLQPAFLPQRLGVAARQRHRGTGHGALRLPCTRRRRSPARSAARRATSQCTGAGAVCRHCPRAAPASRCSSSAATCRRPGRRGRRSRSCRRLSGCSRTRRKASWGWTRSCRLAAGLAVARHGCRHGAIRHRASSGARRAPRGGCCAVRRLGGASSARPRHRALTRPGTPVTCRAPAPKDGCGFQPSRRAVAARRSGQWESGINDNRATWPDDGRCRGNPRHGGGRPRAASARAIDDAAFRRRAACFPTRRTRKAYTPVFAHLAEQMGVDFDLVGDHRLGRHGGGDGLRPARCRVDGSVGLHHRQQPRPTARRWRRSNMTRSRSTTASSSAVRT